MIARSLTRQERRHRARLYRRVRLFQESWGRDELVEARLGRAFARPGFQTSLRGEFVEGDRFFRLLERLVYVGVFGTFTVPVGFTCDLESLPKWALPYSISSKAGVLHDFLYRTKLVSRRVADAIYFEALEAQGVASIRCWNRWFWVRVGGHWAYKKAA